MSIVAAELSVSSDAFILGQILHNGEDVQIDLTQFVPVKKTLVPHFWAQTRDFERFETSVRADERVSTLSEINSGCNKSLYRIEWSSEIDGLLAAFLEHDLIVKGATGNTASWRFRIRGQDHGNLTAFQQTCQEHDVPIDVRRVWHPTDPDANQYGLTEKQIEAMQTAFTDGYFDVPRGTTLGNLGETVGITGQSFARRLARGSHRLIDETLMADSTNKQ